MYYVSYIKVPPDGKWGWVVVFGAALTNMVNQSLVSIFGLLFGEEIARMRHGTVGAALVMNISSMVTNLSGIAIGPLLRKYSPRVVACNGVLLVFTGLIISSAAKNLLYFIVGYGIFVGLGLGLIMPSSFVAVNSYFRLKRNSAIGLSMAGTGIGQMMMPQVLRLLLDEYGYRWATLLLAALSLHGLAGTLLFEPVERHMKLLEVTKSHESTRLLSNKTFITTSNEKDRGETSNSKGAVMRKFSLWIDMLDLKLLQDPTFVHIIIGLSVVYSSSITFSMLFPFYLQQGIGLTRAETALSMSLLSAADIVARLTIPLTADKLKLGNRITFLYGALMLALCRSFLAEQTTLATVLTASVLCGYVRAATVINQNLTVSEYCDEKKLPAALGLNMVTKGLVVLTLGQFFGWIRDYTMSFSTCIHVQSGFLLLVVFTWSGEILVAKKFRT